jgi:hypothetical membrane protein
MIMASINVRRLYAVALIGIVLYLILDVVAQLLPPHYSPISQAESDLAVGPFGYIMAINFLNRGVLSLAFLFAFIGTIRLTGEKVAQYRIGFFLFGTWSIGALLLAIFPTDVPATPISWHGAIHLVVALIAFLTGAFGALVLSLRMSGNPTLRNVRRFALPVAVLVVVFCLIEVLVPFFAPHLATHFGGLFERIFLGTMLAWIVAISVYMVKGDSKTFAPTILPRAHRE